MSDVTCPYCKTEQEINHDDGYGYEEGKDHEQECIHCEEAFYFSTSVSFTYDVYCEAGKHDMEPLGEKYPGMYQCKNCDFYDKK